MVRPPRGVARANRRPRRGSRQLSEIADARSFRCRGGDGPGDGAVRKRASSAGIRARQRGPWRQSLTLDPSDAGAETGLGTALFENGQAQQGYEHLRKAIDMAPDFPDAHNQLGWELAKTGRMDEAGR